MPSYIAAKPVSNYHGSAWSEERVELLRKLWIEGVSASEIARECNKLAGNGSISRNAAIGKVHRLGLTGRATRYHPTPQRVRSKPSAPRLFAVPQRAAKPKVLHVEPFVPPPEILEPTVSGVLDLIKGQCKWPMTGTGEGFSFCGREASGVYCSHHENLAHAPAPKRGGAMALKKLGNLR